MAWPLCPTFAKKPTDLNAGIDLSYSSPVVFSEHCIIVEDKRWCLKQHILEYNEDSTKSCTFKYVISLNSVLLNHIVPFQALLPVYCISWYCYNCGTGHYNHYYIPGEWYSTIYLKICILLQVWFSVPLIVKMVVRVIELGKMPKSCNV